MVARATACVLLLAVGCSSDPASRDVLSTAPTSTTATTAPPVTTPPPPAAPTTTLPVPFNADQARRLLEQQGIDPADLSHEVGEHMRRRFRPAPAE